MHEMINPRSNSDSKNTTALDIRLLDGRVINISIDEPFSIEDDITKRSWDLSWLKPKDGWHALVLNQLLSLFRTHSLSYANQVAFAAKALFDRALFLEGDQLNLDNIARAPELIPMTYWPFLQPLLKRMARQDTNGAVSDELKVFLGQPTKWETKGNGAYFALVTNDPVHGAFTEQELSSIHEGANRAYEQRRINLEKYALVWFLIGTGVRPVQVARMKVGDVKIYDGPEGKEVTLYIPLAKGEGSPDQRKWRRRCPTILAEILVEYLERKKANDDQSLFQDQSSKVSSILSQAFNKIQTYSKRTDTSIHISSYRFRYTLGTRAIALGGSDEEVARLLTHRSTSCVAKYRAAMPELQNPLRDALSGEISIIASVFNGKLIKDLDDATRKGQVDALIRDFLHLNGEAIGACGTEAKCYQHAPRACLICNKFEPFLDAPWDDLLEELQADMNIEDEDKIKIITLPFIEAVTAIKEKCEQQNERDDA